MRMDVLDNKKWPFIIAEASGNHSQDIQMAHDLIDAAAAAGADAIKFQTFTPVEIAADIALPRGKDPQLDAWMDRLKATSLRDVFTHGGLPRHWHKELKKHAENCGVVFLSTPFSVDAARFLVEDLGVECLKISSGDLTYQPLLDYVARTQLPIILSTGMGTMEEVRRAVSRFLWPAYTANHLALLHCRSLYPCDYTELNLRAIKWLKRTFPGCPVGCSDHTLDTQKVPAAAATLGCTIFEKHLKLPGSTGPDVNHSLLPIQFEAYCATIRQTIEMLGEGGIAPHPREQHDRLWGRRSKTDWLRPQEEARQGRWE